jgi:hypothetical protein
MIHTPTMFSEIDGLDNEFSQAEALLPLQFYGARRGAATTEPLRRLMLAMLLMLSVVSRLSGRRVSRPDARSLRKCGPGSSLTTITVSSPSERFVMHWP